ncbi:MAG: thiamine-phosphate kinase [bacterium]
MIHELKVKDIGEFGLISRIEKMLGSSSEMVLVGLGDDTATIKPHMQPLVITTDTMVEDVHFRRDWSSPEDVAHKALASNLSDLAAKCACPAFYLVTIGLPVDTPVRWVEELYQRLVQLNQEWKVELVGGDTIRSDKILISITACGYQTTTDPVRTRNARVGDRILVSGTLGDAAAGLDLLPKMRETELSQDHLTFLLKRFNQPTPRNRESAAIARILEPHAMTDISDGLAREIPKICAAAGVGARVDASKLPCSEALRAFAGEQAVRYAWKGGEDYELLLTVSEEHAEVLLSQWDTSLCPLTEIGVVTEQTDGVRVDGFNGSLEPGFDHYRE